MKKMIFAVAILIGLQTAATAQTDQRGSQTPTSKPKSDYVRPQGRQGSETPQDKPKVDYVRPQGKASGHAKLHPVSAPKTDAMSSQTRPGTGPKPSPTSGMPTKRPAPPTAGQAQKGPAPSQTQQATQGPIKVPKK